MSEMSHGGPHPNVSPDAAGLYDQFGITPGAAAGLPPQEPMILMGYKETRRALAGARVRGGTIPEGVEPPGTVQRVQERDLRTFDQAVADVYSWDDKKFEQFANQLVAAGRIPPSYSRDQVIAQWRDLVQQAQVTSAGGKAMSPWDILAFLGTGPGAGPPSPKTVVQKQVHISTPDEARAILRQTLASYLGRAPSESELDNFQSNLNAAQERSPAITTTTTSPTGETVQSTTEGGVDVGAFAGEYARERFGEEAGDYQVGAFLLPEFLQLLESPVD